MATLQSASLLLSAALFLLFVSDSWAASLCPGVGGVSTSSNCSTSDSACLCRPRTPQQLVEQYNTYHYNSACAILTSIEVPLQDGGFSWTTAYVITGKSSCFETAHHGACFNMSSVDSQCSWKKTWIDLGVNHFPRFISHLECRGGDKCNAFGRGPRFFEVLRRQGRCDSSGLDVWEKVTLKRDVHFICSCLLKTL